MEEDKLNSMIEGIKGGEKEAKKEEEKKNITGVLKDLGVDVKNDKEDPEKDEKINDKLAKGVIEYIWMKQGGHLKYGISFIAAQVI